MDEESRNRITHLTARVAVSTGHAAGKAGFAAATLWSLQRVVRQHYVTFDSFGPLEVVETPQQLSDHRRRLKRGPTWEIRTLAEER
ncbi:hypothetical protein [Agromyces sp. NPDC058126]|uniref:hypothetical protein n=1 Tax=Agromyces sp. NPDC058126 TaxID=3346350 RepID=UPI0036DF2524